MHKNCYKCGLKKDVECFSVSKSKPDGRNDQCKSCQKDYKAAHYKKNKDLYLAREKARKQDLYKWFRELKSGLKCEVCGENHPAALDFHHKNPAEKDFELGAATNCGYSKDRILEEIAKCYVWCANCHRKHHWNEAHSSTG